MSCSSPFSWQWTSGREPSGNISGTIALAAPATGTLTLRYRCNGELFDQLFRPTVEPCRFGGHRWFAICPVTGRHAAKLCCLGGAGFHARQRYGRVAYWIQRTAGSIDRALMRRDRTLFRKLRGDDPDFVTKPNWMRWRTYDRIMQEFDAADRQIDHHLARLIGRLC